MVDFNDEQIARFVRESNHIEGISVDTPEEIAEFKRFMGLETVTVYELQRFVSVYQPNAVLRDRAGLDVSIGGHVPLPGGKDVLAALNAILLLAHENAPLVSDFDEYPGGDKCARPLHVAYEKLHPFTDGNGRSGRMLWYWIMRNDPQIKLGFLHAFYYQTLAFSS